jgi:eukaryotic-like serine/threonine-protein kinase
MAAVYAATHANNGSRVALKILHAEFCVHEDVRRRFLREGYVGNRVQHPGAPRVLDDDIAEDGSPFLVMELLEGQPLDEVWKACERKIPPLEVLSIADQLLDVLAAAHVKGIIHATLNHKIYF